MPPAAHFGCAEGAVQFVKPHPPLRGPYLFCHGRKDMEEKTVRTRNSAVAPEKRVVPFCVLSFRCRCQNALRAAVESAFPIARHTARVVLVAPVEYLTYGSRRAAAQQALPCISRTNELPFKSRPKQTQSISTTTPVCQIRICSAFYKFEICFCTNQTPGKIQGRGPQPPSWSF